VTSAYTVVTTTGLSVISATEATLPSTPTRHVQVSVLNCSYVILQRNKTRLSVVPIRSFSENCQFLLFGCQLIGINAFHSQDGNNCSNIFSMPYFVEDKLIPRTNEEFDILFNHPILY